MEHAKPRTHVVVGDGITAVAFIEHSGLAAGDTLIVLGKAATRLGRGVAYAAGPEALPWRYAYLLNSPADDIDPAFARWLSDRWADVSGTMRGRAPNWLAAAQPLVEAGDIYGVNAPREFYGDFMAEQVAALLAELRARGVAVRLEDACVSALEREGGGVRLFTEDGRSFLADSVDVAPGGPSTLRITGDVGAFSVPTLFGHEARIAEHIRAGAEIFCIGGNAAMLDALRLCQSLIPEADLRFVACAPDGAVPPPLVPRMPRKLTVPDLAAGHETAEAFLQEVWRAIEAARAAGDEMREIRAGFRAYFLEHGLARFVPDQDEARRVPVQLRFWLRGGTRDTILDFHRLMAAGKTRMLTGMVRGIEHKADHVEVVIRDAAGQERVHRTGFVINCAGAGGNSRHDALTEHLLERGWLSVCPVNKGLEVGAGCRTGLGAVRHLSPATTVIGEEVMAMPLYDAHMLRTLAARACGVAA